ncbi:MAG TPA: NADH-quinone oxidoreductase subunit H, partial [Longimicrobium sp.]
IKTFFFIMVFMIVRWTVPRFRYDQVMDLGWKVMLPAALAAVVFTAATVLALDSAGVRVTDRALGIFPTYGLVLAAVNAVMLAAVLWVLDKGHVLTGTGAMEAKRAHAQELARRRTAARPTRVPVGGAAQP